MLINASDKAKIMNNFKVKKVAKIAGKSFSSPAQSAMGASAGMSGPMGMGTSKIGQISSPGTTYGMQKYSDGGMVRAKPN